MRRSGPEATPPTRAGSLGRVRTIITTPLRKENAFEA